MSGVRPTLSGFLIAADALAADGISAGQAAPLGAFIESYCADCHDDAEKKGA